jgi:hypothetical protein
VPPLKFACVELEEDPMRASAACTLLFVMALPVAAPAAHAAGLPPAISVQSSDAIVTIDAKRYRRGRDCVPYNGPFGFYGNIWCEPNETVYLRNLGSPWPQNTPPSLRKPKPSSNYEW